MDKTMIFSFCTVHKSYKIPKLNIVAIREFTAYSKGVKDSKIVAIAVRKTQRNTLNWTHIE